MSYLKPYVNFLEKFLRPRSKLKVVFDCSNGTAGIILSELFRELRSKNYESRIHNSKFIILNSRPDGNFPAHGPNPMAEGAMNDLSKAVLKNQADLGVIFDADGDRAFFVDDLGRSVISDQAAALIAKGFRGLVVTDLLAGYIARELINRKRIIESRVGSYFIKKLMKEKGATFGAEASGHYYFSFDHYFFDSGILASIHFINQVSLLKEKNRRLSSWIDSLPGYFRSRELNFSVSDKQSLLKAVEKHYRGKAEKISHLDGLKMEFDSPAGGWWFSLRPSNTEDLLRLNLESKNKKIFEEKLSELENLLSAA